MQLRSTLLLIIFGVFGLYLGVEYGVQRLIIFPYFVEAERLASIRDANRAAAGITREIDHVAMICRDWAAWDQMYHFVVNRDQDFIASNLTTETFSNLSINVLYICDKNGHVVWGSIRDAKAHDCNILSIKRFESEALSRSDPLLGQTSLTDAVAGIIVTERGPLVLASRPILTTANTGPTRGTLIMGRFLNDEVIKTLMRQSGVSFGVRMIDRNPLPEEDKSILARLSPDTPQIVKECNPNLLHVYSAIGGLDHSPVLLIRAEIPRVISATVRAVTRFTQLSILAVGLLVVLVMHFSLRRLVIEPLSELTTHAMAIGESSDLSARLQVVRADEIGTLAREFNRMVEQLATARKRLQEESYYSGKVEMAAGVLHNIRNSLNPIVVQIDGLREDLGGVPVEQIECAREELAQEASPDDRRKDLSRFLHLACGNLSDLVRRTTRRLGELSGQANRIERILLDYDGLHRAQPPVEDVGLEETVRDALTLLNDDLRKIISIEIDPDLASIGTIRVHRILLLQVFGNLLTNAAESIRRAHVTDGRVTISAVLEPMGEGSMVHVRVCDNGEGIDPTDLDRIFGRGFSTKAGGTGVGLHWSSNTLAAMHGRLWAESEGKGKGACMHVRIPTKV